MNFENKNIRVGSIKSEFNIRFEDDEKSYELMESIRDNGLIHPITVKSEGNGYLLIAGNRRFEACKKLGMKTINARIAPSWVDELRLNITENHQRVNISPCETGRGINQIMKVNSLNKKEVAAYLNMDIKDINRCLSLYKETPVKYAGKVVDSRKGTKQKRGTISKNSAYWINSKINNRTIPGNKRDEFYNAALNANGYESTVLKKKLEKLQGKKTDSPKSQAPVQIKLIANKKWIKDLKKVYGAGDKLGENVKKMIDYINANKIKI